METSRIRKLLAKYYDGQTSEEEERELARLFASGDVPDDMAEERLFFVHLHGSNDTSGVPYGFEERLEDMVDRLAEADGAGRSAVVPLRRRLKIVAGIAASVLLLNRVDNMHTPSVDDRIALAQAQEAILKFSMTLNKGLNSMEAAGRETKAIGERMDKCLEMTKIPTK